MTSEFFDELKGLLVQPVVAFQELKEKPIIAVLGFFAVILLIFSVLSSIVYRGFTNPLGLVVGIILLYILYFVAIFIFAAILHLFVYLVGGRAGVEQTIKAALYAFTPFGLVGWILFIHSSISLVGWLGVIWSLILAIIGIRELQDLSTGKAVLAVLPFIFILILDWVLIVPPASLSQKDRHPPTR